MQAQNYYSDYFPTRWALGPHHRIRRSGRGSRSGAKPSQSARAMTVLPLRGRGQGVPCVQRHSIALATLYRLHGSMLGRAPDPLREAPVPVISPLPASLSYLEFVGMRVITRRYGGEIQIKFLSKSGGTTNGHSSGTSFVCKLARE